MTGRLAGKVALITGGAGGIGVATSRLFCREGAAVTLVGRGQAALDQALDYIRAEVPGARVMALSTDISREDDVRQAVEQTVAAFGSLSVLVNNAAIREIGTVLDKSADDWERILRVNVIGTALCARLALPALRAARPASIVNVSSVYGEIGRAGWGLYDATKAAMMALTRTLACEEAANGVRVNTVSPGSTLTPFTLGRASARGMNEETLKESGAAPSLLRRWGEPDEVAYPILWMASEEASFITGTNLMVDGGLATI